MITTEESLTSEELQYLVRVLEGALAESRVEARHTRTSDYREKVRHEQELIRGLLEKVRRQ